MIGFCFLNYPAYLQKSLGCLLFKIEVMNLCLVMLNARRWKSKGNYPTCSGIWKAVTEKQWHKTTEMTKWLQVRFSVAWKVRWSGVFCRRCQPYKVIFFTFEMTLLYSIKVCLVLHFYSHVLKKNSQPQLDCLICVHWLVCLSIWRHVTSPPSALEILIQSFRRHVTRHYLRLSSAHNFSA